MAKSKKAKKRKAPKSKTTAVTKIKPKEKLDLLMKLIKLQENIIIQLKKEIK